MTEERKRVHRVIDQYICRLDDNWHNWAPGDDQVWLTFLTDKLGGVAATLVEGRSEEGLDRALFKLAAVLIKWMELRPRD